MDFDDSPEEAAFRQECRTWLAANAKLRTPGIAEVWRTLRPRDEGEDDASLLVGKRWQALKADAGFAGIQWPVEYGGRGLSGHLAGVFTVLLMAGFIGVWIWLWLPRHRRTFGSMARLPMEDGPRSDDTIPPTAEEARR